MEREGAGQVALEKQPCRTYSPDTWESWPANVRFAALLTDLFDGSLTGLCIVPPAAAPPDVSSSSLFSELVEIFRERIDAAYRAEAAFKTWAAERGVPRSDWYVTRSSIDEALSRAADWFDLLMLERGAGLPWGSVNDLGRLLLTVGLPCVLIPPQFDGPLRLDTIAVAWKGTPQSLRALHAALPLLRSAERVVLIRDSGPDAIASIDWSPSRRIQSYLSWQGLQAQSKAIEVGDGSDSPAAIFAAAAQESADLLDRGHRGFRIDRCWRVLSLSALVGSPGVGSRECSGVRAPGA